ncbi:MAG TPA: hypothetical protein VGC26_01955, partial [Afipia sp.]
MTTHFSRRIIVPMLALALSLTVLPLPDASAQVAAPSAGTASATDDNALILTVFLKHDQSRPLSELNAQLEKQGFYKAFPPAGVEVLSWNVVMGIGQIIVLKL